MRGVCRFANDVGTVDIDDVGIDLRHDIFKRWEIGYGIDSKSNAQRPIALSELLRRQSQRYANQPCPFAEKVDQLSGQNARNNVAWSRARIRIGWVSCRDVTIVMKI